MRRSVGHRRRDAGSSAIELVLLTPLLIVIIFGLVQAALLWHAQHVVSAAAQQGARFARADAASGAGSATDPATVRTETISYLHQLGADLVGQPAVSITRSSGLGHRDGDRSCGVPAPGRDADRTRHLPWSGRGLPTMTATRGADAGTTTIELVILAPIILVLLCFIVGLGRIADTRGQLTGAVRDAARAASLAPTPTAAQSAAAQTARADLADAGIDCEGMTVSVNTAAFRPGGQVSVRLACTTDLSGLVVTGLPGHTTLHAAAVVPLDRYAQVGT